MKLLVDPQSNRAHIRKSQGRYTATAYCGSIQANDSVRDGAYENVDCESCKKMMAKAQEER